MGGYNSSMASVRPMRQAFVELRRWRRYWRAQDPSTQEDPSAAAADAVINSDGPQGGRRSLGESNPHAYDSTRAGGVGLVADATEHFPYYPYPQTALAEHLAPTSGLYVQLYAPPWLYVIAPHWTLEATRQKARNVAKAKKRGTPLRSRMGWGGQGWNDEDAPTSSTKLVIQCQVPTTAPIFDVEYAEDGITVVGGGSKMEMCVFLLPHIDQVRECPVQKLIQVHTNTDTVIHVASALGS
jgi:hypothetical protein